MERQNHKQMWKRNKNAKRNQGIKIKEDGNITRMEPRISNSYRAIHTSGFSLAQKLVRPVRLSTNIDSLIKSTTPFVPIRRFTKNPIQGWEDNNSNPVHYFKLGDLWETYREWSAYGVGVPLLLDGKNEVVQYYIPYLSAIQLYVNPSNIPTRLRQPKQESNYNSCSSSASNNENDVHSNNPMGSSMSNQNGDEVVHPLGKLMFEYFEKESPYNREPLSDKVFKLATLCPELNSYSSCDLKQSSWMSVTWYPIYRIPIGSTLRNIEACFLTFHSLGGPKNNMMPISKYYTKMKSTSLWEDNVVKDGKFQVSIFGMAHYKLNNSGWNLNDQYERQQALSLQFAADEWVHKLGIHHPDYKFFVSRR